MKNKAQLTGIICATMYLVLVIYFVCAILKGDEPVWPMYWLILAAFNLPALLLNLITSNLLMPLFKIIATQFPAGTPLDDPVNFWSPLFYFGILGTAMWYFLPYWFVKIIMAKREKNKRDF